MRREGSKLAEKPERGMRVGGNQVSSSWARIPAEVIRGGWETEETEGMRPVIGP